MENEDFSKKIEELLESTNESSIRSNFKLKELKQDVKLFKLKKINNNINNIIISISS